MGFLFQKEARLAILDSPWLWHRLAADDPIAWSF
jgi:hypothetical protein